MTPLVQSLPPVTRLALAALKAPALEDLDALRAWSQTGLTATTTCGGTLPDTPRVARALALGLRTSGAAGAVQHTLTFDPRTLDATVRAPKGADPEGEHFLWTLAYDAPTGCDRFRAIVGAMADLEWLIANRLHGTSQIARLHAIRTVARTIQYLDAGIDPSRHEAFLRYGLTVEATAAFIASIENGAVEAEAVLAAIESALAQTEDEMLDAALDGPVLVSRLLDPAHDWNADGIHVRAKARAEARAVRRARRLR